MLRRLTPVLILIGLLLFVSCDREDRIAGVPKATKLGELSEEQADAFCAQMEEELAEKTVRFLEGEMKHIMCFLSAQVASLFSDNGEEACQTSFDECMADDSPIDLGDEGGFCAETTAFAGCEVAVGDYATCMHDTLDEAFGRFSILADFTCADLQTADGQERLEQAMEILSREEDDRELDAASCAPIRELCPALGGPQQPELQ